VGLRDFQDNKCDIIAKYSDDDVRNLREASEEEEDNTPFDFNDI